jgi:beta-lactamase class A
MNKSPISHYLIAAAGIIVLCGIFALGWYGRHWYAAAHPRPATPSATEVRADSSEYKFINPILYSNDDKQNYTELDPLVNSLNAYIKTATADGDADSVSVYFRDLNSGHWTGINENEQYQPASLLKVAILLAYLKHATEDPSFLDKQVYYQAASTTDQYYPPAKTLASGYYTAEQLLESMIVYSDNSAETALLMADETDFNNLLKTFQLPVVPADTSNYASSNFMSAAQYSTFFRALYNGTYLPWDLSEQALGLLASTNFHEGLVAGVASGTIVAHKFGERTSTLKDGSLINRELHDCGIIYYSDDPYLLCVMTQGQTFPQLANVISTISKLVYTYVAANDND